MEGLSELRIHLPAADAGAAGRAGGPSGNTILIIDSGLDFAIELRRALKGDGHQVRVGRGAEEGLAVLEGFQPDAVILDLGDAGSGGVGLLARIRAVDAQVLIIVVAGAGSGDATVEALRAGAFVLPRPLAAGAVGTLLDRAFGEQRRAGALDYYRQRDGQRAGLRHLLGESVRMLRLRTQLHLLLDDEAERRAGMPPAMLVQGEAGTGKELVARALHFDGARRDRPFVRLDCASAPSPRLEARLFGHERDFDGARERQLGLLEAADGGTLFIDEIGATSPALQRGLIELIERGAMRRLGGARDIGIDVRVVAATRHPLDALLRDGRLRADLAGRLDARVQLAPLRERGDDVLLLTQRFVEWHAARHGRRAPPLPADAQAALLRYHWPGNVRELRNLLERAVLSDANGLVEARQIAVGPGAAAAGALPGLDLRELERDALLRALQGSRGNVTRAARALGVTRDTLRYRMAKHAIARRLPGLLPPR